MRCRMQSRDTRPQSDGPNRVGPTQWNFDTLSRPATIDQSGAIDLPVVVVADAIQPITRRMLRRCFSCRTNENNPSVEHAKYRQLLEVWWWYDETESSERQGTSFVARHSVVVRSTALPRWWSVVVVVAALSGLAGRQRQIVLLVSSCFLLVSNSTGDKASLGYWIQSETRNAKTMIAPSAASGRHHYLERMSPDPPSSKLRKSSRSVGTAHQKDRHRRFRFPQKLKNIRTLSNWRASFR